MARPPEQLWRATHYHNLRPSDARRAVGAWEWELQDPAGYSLIGSCYPLREVMAASPDRLQVYRPPDGSPEIIVEAP
jgi:hypothetical protein